MLPSCRSRTIVQELVLMRAMPLRPGCSSSPKHATKSSSPRCAHCTGRRSVESAAEAMRPPTSGCHRHKTPLSSSTRASSPPESSHAHVKLPSEVKARVPLLHDAPPAPSSSISEAMIEFVSAASVRMYAAVLRVSATKAQQKVAIERHRAHCCPLAPTRVGRARSGALSISLCKGLDISKSSPAR